MWARSTLLALGLVFSFHLPALGYEFDEDEFAEPAAWTEIKEPRKGATCMDMCLADGEELFDCEYYCIQTAKVGPLVPRDACGRK